MADQFCTHYGCGKPTFAGADTCITHQATHMIQERHPLISGGPTVDDQPELVGGFFTPDPNSHKGKPPLMSRVGNGIGVAIGFGMLLVVLSLATIGFAAAGKLFGLW